MPFLTGYLAIVPGQFADEKVDHFPEHKASIS
jgi:hypothetical protein